MAQLVKHQTVNFGSGRDLMVRGFKPRIRLHADSTGPAWDSLSLPLLHTTPHVLSLSLSKINKINLKRVKENLMLGLKYMKDCVIQGLDNLYAFQILSITGIFQVTVNLFI